MLSEEREGFPYSFTDIVQIHTSSTFMDVYKAAWLLAAPTAATSRRDAIEFTTNIPYR